MFARFYQEELEYLRLRAPEFADAHPGLANALATRDADPDVERLLQGFAFLTARVRQRIEDDFPEIVHTLLELLWPQCVRPTPSGCIVEFSAKAESAQGWIEVPAGTEIRSVRTSKGVPCQFRTCWPLNVPPLTLDGARLEQTPEGDPALTLSFQLLKGLDFRQVFGSRPDTPLRLFLHGDGTAAPFLAVLGQRLRRVFVRAGRDDGSAPTRGLCPDAVRFPGLDARATVLPEPPSTFSGFSTLRDYFVFPNRFHFVDVFGLGDVQDLPVGEEFELVFVLKDWPETGRQVSANHFRLGCVPVVNLFERDGRPVRVAREMTEYRLLPDSDVTGEMEPFAVVRLSGIPSGSGEERTFEPLYSLGRAPMDYRDSHVYYRSRVRQAVSGRSTETWISLVDIGNPAAIPAVETISSRLLCSNGTLPMTLRTGSLTEPSFQTPSGVTFRDITKMLPPLPPVLDGSTAWQLVSLIATSYLSIASVENLRALLQLLDFRSVHDKGAGVLLKKRLSAIESVTVVPDDHLVRGRAVRGRAIEVAIHDAGFGNAADVHLFGSVLDVVLSMFSSINSHTRLKVVAVDSRETFEWKPRHGMQILQ